MVRRSWLGPGADGAPALTWAVAEGLGLKPPRREWLRYLGGPLALPQSELAFLRRAVTETLSRGPLLLPFAHLAGAVTAVIARSPRLRRRLLPAFFRWIPSPPDFDHITYLRRHTKLWATRFNGPGEWLPYHHWLLNHALGAGDRPTLPDPGDASKTPGGKKGNQPSAHPQAQRAKSGRPPRP